MKRSRVSSTSIVSAGYDERSKTLEVQFEGGVYQYHRVPMSAYRRFLAASSKGRFVNRFIKPKYAYTAVERLR